MEADIKKNINNPKQLEKLYRENPHEFRTAFLNVYPLIKDFSLSVYWRVRLEFDSKQKSEKKKVTQTSVADQSKNSSPTQAKVEKTQPLEEHHENSATQQLNTEALSHTPSQSTGNIKIFLLICGITILLINIPKIFKFNEVLEVEYTQKFAALIFLLGLGLYLVLTQEKTNALKVLIAIIIPTTLGIYMYYSFFASSAVYEDTIKLAYLHNIFLVWTILGIIYVNFQVKNLQYRINYIRYNANVILLMTVIALFGMLLVTLYQYLIKQRYINLPEINIIPAPTQALYIASIIILLFLFATYINQKNLLAIHKVTPLLAKIFSPLVTLFLIAYITMFIINRESIIDIAMSIINQGNIVEDRTELLIFNVMLVIIIAMIFFFIAEAKSSEHDWFYEGLLLFLSVLSLICGLLTLIAIINRLSEYSFQFTPNRIAILGENVLIIANLIGIIIAMYKVTFKGKSMSVVKVSIAKFLPIYGLWFAFMVFILPLIFKNF